MVSENNSAVHVLEMEKHWSGLILKFWEGTYVWSLMMAFFESKKRYGLGRNSLNLEFPRRTPAVSGNTRGSHAAHSFSVESGFMHSKVCRIYFTKNRTAHSGDLVVGSFRERYPVLTLNFPLSGFMCWGVSLE